MSSATRTAFRAAGCLLLAFSALACRAETGVTGSRILLGQSAAFSGPAVRLGIDLHAGAKLYFDNVNQQGGIYGRKSEIVTADDKYQPELSHEEFIAALETITLKNYDTGFPVEFSPTRHTGSAFVDMTFITKNEKFLN